MTNPDSVGPVDYASAPARLSPMALWSMILGIIALPAVCILIGPIIGIVALILGIISLVAINKDPQRLAGKGFAIAGIILGIVGSVGVIPLLIAILLPSLGRARELANRAACAANLTGTVKGMVVYANENMDVYPTAGNPASLGAYTSDLGVVSSATDADAALTATQTAAAGNVNTSMWMLVLRNQETPKNLLYKSDPFAASMASPITDASGHYYLTPAAANQLSYSIAYPWAGTKSVGGWWKSTTLSDLPVMSDLAPLDGTGLPRRTVTALSVARAKEWNSFNHNGDGQNVGFADAHSEWKTTPQAGESLDNIFTVGSGSSQRAASPGMVPAIGTTTPPYDTIMVPLRDGGSGAVR